MYRQKFIRPETKDLGDGRIHAVLSTQNEDRDGDIIHQDGWDLDSFQAHPVLLTSHNYGSLQSQIGEWQNVSVRGRGKSARLEGEAVYYTGQGNAEADWGYKLATRGRAAYSVGFMPLDFKERDSKDSDSWFGPFDFFKQELLEASHVTIPSNRESLALMARSLQHGGPVADIVAEILKDEGAPPAKDVGPSTLLEHAIEVAVYESTERILDAIAALEKGPVRPHGTDVLYGATWDGSAAQRLLRGDEARSYYRRAFAWADSGFEFIHHEVAEGGDIGAANYTACISAIAVLNGGRGGTTIPDADRQGVWNHLARHIRETPEGDRKSPELRDFAAIGRSMAQSIDYALEVQ